LFTSIGYEGSQSRRQVRIVQLNFSFSRAFQPAQPVGFAPVFFLRPDVNGNYNGMNVRLERRFAQGFQLSANYRFAKVSTSFRMKGQAL
jgi:hypothetical protein